MLGFAKRIKFRYKTFEIISVNLDNYPGELKKIIDLPNKAYSTYNGFYEVEKVPHYTDSGYLRIDASI